MYPIDNLDDLRDSLIQFATEKRAIVTAYQTLTYENQSLRSDSKLWEKHQQEKASLFVLYHTFISNYLFCNYPNTWCKLLEVSELTDYDKITETWDIENELGFGWDRSSMKTLAFLFGDFMPNDDAKLYAEALIEDPRFDNNDLPLKFSQYLPQDPEIQQTH